MNLVCCFVLSLTLLSPACCLENYTRTSSSNPRRSDRVKNGKKAVIAAIRAMSSEECDWKSNPISLLRGELCGRYYKILSLTRHCANLSTIEKKYREKSYNLHPDINPSEEAHKAFTSLTKGYLCLVDDTCKSEYDAILRQMEHNNEIRRAQKIHYFSLRLQELLGKVHYYIVFYAAVFDRVANDAWDKLGNVRIFNVQAGRIAALAFAALLPKSVFLAYILSKAVLVLNDALIQATSR